MSRKKEWNLDTIKVLAEQCKTKTEFSIKFSTAYKYALKFGYIETLFPNKIMANVSGYVSQFNSRSEMSKKNARQYLKLKNLGLLDELLPKQKRGRKSKQITLMEVNKVIKESKPKQSWTVEKLKVVIAECGTLTKLNENYRGAYNFGKKHGLI